MTLLPLEGVNVTFLALYSKNVTLLSHRGHPANWPYNASFIPTWLAVNPSRS